MVINRAMGVSSAPGRFLEIVKKMEPSVQNAGRVRLHQSHRVRFGEFRKACRGDRHRFGTATKAGLLRRPYETRRLACENARAIEPEPSGSFPKVAAGRALRRRLSPDKMMFLPDSSDG